MYWIFIERRIAVSEIEETLKILFSELVFHHLDNSKSDWFESPYFHCKDNKNYTYSINDWTDSLRTKIEFHDLDASMAIRITQYIGHYLSKTYNTIVVTEFESNDPYISYRSLMINEDRLIVIDDDGIEFDGFVFKEIRNYEGQVQSFDKYGCL